MSPRAGRLVIRAVAGALVMAVIVPAAGQAPQGIPVDTAAVAPAAAAAPGPAAAAGPRIALLLPLSGRQAAIGRAVRDGFLAGLLAAGDTRVGVDVIDAAGGVATAYGVARDAGADVIVGPLLKEAVEALLPLAGDRPVLALNYLGDDRPGPAGFYQFGLAPEDETAAVADRVLGEGRLRGVALAPDNDWGRRLLNAFNARFGAGGGSLVAWQFYDPAAADFSAPVRTVLGSDAAAARARRLQANLGEPVDFEASARPDVDFIFVAANTGVARRLAPALRFHGAGALPVYATSAVYEDGLASEPDLEGLWFPDSPWVIDPDSRARPVKAALASGSPEALAISRLYALGYDAYGLAVRLAAGPLPTEGYAGVTGRLSVDAGGRVHRGLGFARITGGVAVAADGVAAPPPPAGAAPGP
jgi:outer membrane PBP1 activator LpoA protein